MEPRTDARTDGPGHGEPERASRPATSSAATRGRFQPATGVRRPTPPPPPRPLQPWLTQFARREDLERRHETVFRFFRTTDAGEALAIARGLDARFVCLYGADRLRFDAVLEAVHSEPEARCFAWPAR